MACKLKACITCERFWVKIRNSHSWKNNSNFTKCLECTNHNLWKECKEWRKL